jgi:hypothetical protein
MARWGESQTADEVGELVPGTAVLPAELEKLVQPGLRFWIKRLIHKMDGRLMVNRLRLHFSSLFCTFLHLSAPVSGARAPGSQTTGRKMAGEKWY